MINFVVIKTAEGAVESFKDRAAFEAWLQANLDKASTTRITAGTLRGEGYTTADDYVTDYL